MHYSTALQPGSCAFGTVIENKGARPPPDHSWWASSLGQGQVDVGVEESGIAVSFHQAVDFILRRIKAGPSWLKDVLLNGDFGWVVYVDLRDKVYINYGIVLTKIQFYQEIVHCDERHDTWSYARWEWCRNRNNPIWQEEIVWPTCKMPNHSVLYLGGV